MRPLAVKQYASPEEIGAPDVVVVVMGNYPIQQLPEVMPKSPFELFGVPMVTLTVWVWAKATALIAVVIKAKSSIVSSIFFFI
jgi:hypothetical protein